MKAGTYTDFFFLAIALIIYIYSIRTAMTGRRINLRKLATIEAIPEAVARAAEMGAPIHYSTAAAGTHTSDAAMTIAGLAILGEVARQCGKFGVPLRYSCNISYLIPVGQDLIKQGYTDGGRPEMYNDDMVVYTTEQQRAFMSSVSGYLMREKPAVNMIFGATYWETTVVLGAGAVAGCMQMAGVPRLYYMPIAVTTCDYTLIGEELYAAAAYVENVPHEMATIQAQDWLKAIMIVILILGTIASSIGSDIISKFLGW